MKKLRNGEAGPSWILAARFLPDPPSLESVIERVAYWKSNGDSLDAVYYLYVLHALALINGSVLSEDHAIAALEECQSRARFRRDRPRSFEWLGSGIWDATTGAPGPTWRLGPRKGFLGQHILIETL
jgi:hypothetical protein